MSANQDAVAMSSELPPPKEPVRKDKKHRVHPRPGALTKRPPPRPYKKLPQETLCERIRKLTARMERAKKQVRPSRLLIVLRAIDAGPHLDSMRTPAHCSPSTRTRRRTGCATASRRSTPPQRLRLLLCRSSPPSRRRSQMTRLFRRLRRSHNDNAAGIYGASFPRNEA